MSKDEKYIELVRMIKYNLFITLAYIMVVGAVVSLGLKIHLFTVYFIIMTILLTIASWKYREKKKKVKKKTKYNKTLTLTLFIFMLLCFYTWGYFLAIGDLITAVIGLVIGTIFEIIFLKRIDFK